MSEKYTAADFANARFAEHKDGSVIARCNPDSTLAWENDECLLSDGEMACTGWVPVPTKPSITESDYQELMDSTSVPYGVGFTDGFHRAGGEVIPDPEPTNTERLEEILKEVWTPAQDTRTFAEYLNDNGVTAPNVKDN